MFQIALFDKQSCGRFRVKIMMVPLALTVAMLGSVGWYIQESSRDIKKISDRGIEILELSNNLIYLDEALTMSARMTVATGDIRWENRYRGFESKVEPALERAAQLLPELFKSETMNRANSAAAKLLAMENQAFNLVRQGNREAAVTMLMSGEYEKEKQIFNTSMAEITTAMKKYVESHLQTRAQQASLAVIVVGLAVGILLLSWLTVLRTLIHYIGTINEASSAISGTTAQIASTMEQQDRRVAKQAASVNQTTTAMDELGTCSQQSVQQAESAAEDARQALAIANSGNEAVQRTLEGMAALKQKVEAIAQQIGQLSEQTHHIGNISTLVSDLANQTNMLSLNAAVEAARAGEQGKGFAIIATEIRQLSAQSKRSAEKIGNLVSDIQSAIHTTVMATDEGTKTVNQGAKIAQETAAAFTGVAQAIDNIAIGSQQISLSASQQAIAINQVLEAMNALNEEAIQTASDINQTKVSTQQLNQAVLNLKTLV